MRHRKSGRKLGRTSAHRRAMYRNMVTSLLLHGQIRTTEAKAKELRRIADRVITLGKKSPASALEGLSGEELTLARQRRLHHIRRARVWVKDRAALNRLFGEYADRFKERPGGYTRILKIGARAGDNADMAIIELVEALGQPESVDAGGSDTSSQAEPSAEQGEQSSAS